MFGDVSCALFVSRKSFILLINYDGYKCGDRCENARMLMLTMLVKKVGVSVSFTFYWGVIRLDRQHFHTCLYRKPETE